MTFQETMSETNDKDKYLLSKIYDIFDKSKNIQIIFSISYFR